MLGFPNKAILSQLTAGYLLRLDSKIGIINELKTSAEKIHLISSAHTFAYLCVKLQSLPSSFVPIIPITHQHPYQLAQNKQVVRVLVQTELT
ncbi:hypothetical protein NIES22_49410 [Calothrix brevissima NIES-22]|nr:hypothetical protein NIES22_49410 [Calothrix brevissima NIES-22]